MPHWSTRVIAGLDMIGDSVSRPYLVPLWCGQLTTQLCGYWLLQDAQKSLDAAIASASPTFQLIVNFPQINHDRPAKPPASSVFAEMNQPVLFPATSMNMHATYVYKTQETVM